MRKLIMIFVGLLISMPLYATWQLANPYQGTQYHKNVNPDIGDTSYPESYTLVPQYVVCIKKGYLRENVERIAEYYGWTVYWREMKRYFVLTDSEIGGSSFQMIMKELLDNYPVRVIYNNENKVITVS